jgi:hypothetical protein
MKLNKLKNDFLSLDTICSQNRGKLVDNYFHLMCGN